MTARILIMHSKKHHLASKSDAGRGGYWSASLAAILIGAGAGSAVGAEGLLERERLTGDWFGARDTLATKGLKFAMNYTAEYLANLTGGLKQGSTYNGMAHLSLNMDLQELTGAWKGGSLYVSGMSLHGDGASTSYTGDIQGLSNIEGHSSERLYSFHFRQAFRDEMFAIKFGNLLADDDFSVSDHKAIFFNSSFGWPAFASMNVINTGPAFFVAAPGVHLTVNPTENLYVQAGVYDGDSFDDPTGGTTISERGTHFELGNGQGVFSMYEVGYRASIAKSLGDYKLGGWHHSADFTDTITRLPVAGNYGVYFSADQMIYNETPDGEQGLEAFFRAGFSPDDRSFADFSFDAGLHYAGLLPGRDEDAVGLGFAYVNVSDDVATAEAIGGATILSDYELAVEAVYDISLTPALSLQPSLQWIRHPGGSRLLKDAWVFGLRANLTF
jgi:porin